MQASVCALVKVGGGGFGKHKDIPPCQGPQFLCPLYRHREVAYGTKT